MMKKETAVKTEGLVKTFSGAEVIKNLNMTVPQGCIYGLLGVNGAGKTTVFKMLCGLLEITAGSAAVFGADVLSGRNKVLKTIGSIIEVPVFYDRLTASENLEIHLSYMNAEGDIPATLEMVGLRASLQPVAKFSLGMRQRLGIARALIHKPRLLILDEPTNGLDPMGIREMRALFLRLKHESGMTLLLSSHILSEIEHVADMVGVIAGGTLVQEVRLSAVKEQYPNGLEDYFFQVMRGEDACA